ncbi:hypothetical protein PM082_017857 [Marasmius tenuissimus]|nr:hypothetical protein PM082_017857 [Marasmius tenuissimus]
MVFSTHLTQTTILPKECSCTEIAGARVNLDSGGAISEQVTKSWTIPSYALSDSNELIAYLRSYGHEAQKAMDLVPWEAAPSLMDMIQLVRSEDTTNSRYSADLYSTWIVQAVTKTATSAKLVSNAFFV